MPLPSWTTSMSPSDLRRMPLSWFLPKTRGFPCSSCRTCSLRASRSVRLNQAPSLKMLQFWRISTKAEPLCAAACFSVSFRCAWKTSTLRATKVASAPMAREMGLKGRSTEPKGVDLVFLLNSDVGEHGLYGGENGIVAAARTPADFLVGLEVFFGERRYGRQCGSAHCLSLRDGENHEWPAIAPRLSHRLETAATPSQDSSTAGCKKRSPPLGMTSCADANWVI